MNKRARLLRIIADVMLVFGASFVIYVLNHPECSFNIDLTAIYIIYIAYICVIPVIFI